MAKSKNIRQRVGPDQLIAPLARQSCNDGANCYSHSVLLHPASLGHRSYQDVSDAINYHWGILSLYMKHFILGNAVDLSLRKLVNFWSSPQQIENTSESVAASICGSFWYLALNYIFIGKFAEARALFLHGLFLHQCFVSLTRYLLVFFL